MLIKGLVDEDFLQYKKSAMFIIFPYCSLKCDKENNSHLCQNSSLLKSQNIEISIDSLVSRYLDNPITHAIVCGGLEPFDSWEDLLELVKKFREVSLDDLVIFTGYTEDELKDKIEILKQYQNIILKVDRFRPNQKAHYDETLGINLISDNQYGIKIS